LQRGGSLGESAPSDVDVRKTVGSKFVIIVSLTR
jgi:hypothetical protein